MNTLAFLENINGPELILIFLAVLLLFGAERLPGLFKSLGQSVREFKKATRGIEDDIRSAMESESERAIPQVASQAVPQASTAPSDRDTSMPSSTVRQNAQSDIAKTAPASD